MEILSVKNTKFKMQCVHFGIGTKPLIILPGLSIKSVILSAEAIASGFSLFNEDYSVYVFDRKSNITDSYSTEEMADDTYSAMVQLGISGAYVFGASQGGMIALSLAVRHPDAVAKLVLGSTLSRQNEMSRHVLNEWITLAEKGNPRPLNESIISNVYSEEFINTYRETFNSMLDDATPDELLRFRHLAIAASKFDIYGELDKISCPTLVVGSKRDNVLSGEASLEIAEGLNCELYMYDGYSHAVYDEAPDYRKRMKAFFDK